MSQMDQTVNAEAAALENSQQQAVIESLKKMYQAGLVDGAASNPAQLPVQSSPSYPDLSGDLQAAQSALNDKDATIAQLRSQIDTLGSQNKQKMDAMHALLDQLAGQIDVIAASPAVPSDSQANVSTGSVGQQAVSSPSGAIATSDSTVATQSTAQVLDQPETADGANVDSPVQTNQPVAPPQA